MLLRFARKVPAMPPGIAPKDLSDTVPLSDRSPTYQITVLPPPRAALAPLQQFSASHTNFPPPARADTTRQSPPPHPLSLARWFRAPGLSPLPASPHLTAAAWTRR